MSARCVRAAGRSQAAIVVAVAFAAAVGCKRDQTPTIVEIGLRLGPPDVGGESMELSEAAWPLRIVRAQPCADDDSDLHPVSEGFTAETRTRTLRPGLRGVDRPPNRRALELPRGPWCAIELVPDGPLRVVGVLPSSGATLDAVVALPDLGVRGTEGLGGLVQNADGKWEVQDLLVALGYLSWLEGRGAELAAGNDVTVRPGDADHAAIVSALLRAGSDGGATGAGMYQAARPDVGLSAAERTEGPLAPLQAVGDGPGWTDTGE